MIEIEKRKNINFPSKFKGNKIKIVVLFQSIICGAITNDWYSKTLEYNFKLELTVNKNTQNFSPLLTVRHGKEKYIILVSYIYKMLWPNNPQGDLFRNRFELTRNYEILT